MEEIFPWLYFYVYKSVNPSFTSNFLGFHFSHSTKKGNLEVQRLLFKRFFSAKTIFLIRIYHQQFQRTSLLMVLDFLAKHTPFSRPLLPILNNLHFTKQGPLKLENEPIFWREMWLWNIPRDTKVTVFGTTTSPTTEVEFPVWEASIPSPQCILVPVVCLQLQGLWPTSHTVPVPSRCNQNRPGLWSCLGPA